MGIGSQFTFATVLWPCFQWFEIAMVSLVSTRLFDESYSSRQIGNPHSFWTEILSSDGMESSSISSLSNFDDHNGACVC